MGCETMAVPVKTEMQLEKAVDVLKMHVQELSVVTRRMQDAVGRLVPDQPRKISGVEEIAKVPRPPEPTLLSTIGYVGEEIAHITSGIDHLTSRL